MGIFNLIQDSLYNKMFPAPYFPSKVKEIKPVSHPKAITAFLDELWFIIVYSDNGIISVMKKISEGDMWDHS